MRRLLLLLALTLLLPAAPASAQTPAGCFSLGFNVGSTWTPAKARAGRSSTLKVVASQVGANACNVSGVTVTVALPGPDGEPSATSTSLAENASYPANAPSTTLGELPYTVAVNAGVTRAKARVTVSGTVHDVPGGSPFSTTREVGLPIVVPKLGLTVIADPATGTVPLTVVYRFALTNLGEPQDPLGSVTLAHPYCVPVYASGDSDGDKAIGATETWRYTCTRVFRVAANYTSTSGASAISAPDGLGVDATPVTTLVRVVAPSQSPGHLTLTTVASPPRGFVPFSVVYNYTVLNDSPAAIPISDLSVVDAGCAPVTTGAPNIPLIVDAARGFSCTKLFSAVGTFGSGAIATGTDTTTGLPVSSAQVSTEVTATDASAAAATPTPVAAEPEAPATPTSAVKPSTRIVFTASGRFARPCRGNITLTLKAGTKTLGRKLVKPTSTCRYSARFDIARSRIGKATRVTATARLGKRTKTQRLAVPKL